MKKILVIHSTRLTHEAHYQFVVTFKAMAEASGAVKALLATWLLTLVQLLDLERVAINAPQGSSVTAKIKAADKMLDKLLGLVLTAIDAAKYSANPLLVQAAKELLFALKPYGHIQSKRYEAEIGAVKSLLQDLREKYLAQATTVGILQWLDQLQEAIEIEEALFAQRNVENAHRAQLKKMKAIRPEVDSLLRQMVERVEIAAATDTTGVYDTFIAELNEKIRYENERHNPRRTNIDNAIIDNVPEQTLNETGYATPLCNVSISDRATGNMVKLVFAKDYTTTYRRNNKLGNAELIVHGKGGYKGQKMVTFSIV
jgi:hypothetical protein